MTTMTKPEALIRIEELSLLLPHVADPAAVDYIEQRRRALQEIIDAESLTVFTDTKAVLEEVHKRE